MKKKAHLFLLSVFLASLEILFIILAVSPRFIQDQDVLRALTERKMNPSPEADARLRRVVHNARAKQWIVEAFLGGAIIVNGLLIVVVGRKLIASDNTMTLRG